MCYRVWRDGKFTDIDEPQEIIDRLTNTLEFYHDQMEQAKKKAAKTREEVIAGIKNEYAEQNARLRQELRFTIASVSSEAELKAYCDFVKKHQPCRERSKIDGGKLPWIMQFGTGLGVCTKLQCPVCGAVEDITDTSIW